MVLKQGLGAAAFAVVMMAAPAAFAADVNSCGLAPFEPALPDSAAIAQMAPQAAEDTRHQAFEDVIAWQKGLKTYRACLDTLRDDRSRKIALDKSGGSKDDQDEIKTLQGEVTQIDDRFNRTVDTEKSVVASYQTVAKAYCSRKDVDQTVCQAAK